MLTYNLTADKEELTLEIISNETELSTVDMDELVVLCATELFTVFWKELFSDSKGKFYGAFDEKGNIYPEVKQLMDLNNIKIDGDYKKHWKRSAWLRADQLKDTDGKPLKRFWEIEVLKKELLKWIKPIKDGGYGAEYMILKNKKGKIVGFSSYTVANHEAACELAPKRYTQEKLNTNGTKKDIATLLKELYPNKNIGFLFGMAILEKKRGLGLGRALFDLRVQRMLELKAEAIVGRTSPSVQSQYQGNYLKIGMLSIASDASDPDKVFLAANVAELKLRPIVVKLEETKERLNNASVIPVSVFPPSSLKPQAFFEKIKLWLNNLIKDGHNYYFVRSYNKIYFSLDKIDVKAMDEFKENMVKSSNDDAKNIIKDILFLNDVLIIKTFRSGDAREIENILKENMLSPKLEIIVENNNNTTQQPN